MDLQTLTQRVAARMDGLPGGQQVVPLLPGLLLFRQTQPTALRAELYEPVICLILQGSKTVTVGTQALVVGPGDALLVTHDLSVGSRVTAAQPAQPYLSIVLTLDLGLLRSLYEEVGGGPAEAPPARSAVVQRAEAPLIDALARYVALTDPLEQRVMGPLLQREIHFRLLMAPEGGMLRQLLRHDSHASSVARAITRIRREFRRPLAVPDLARDVGMSLSSFHRHFRDITANTPLQYQKELRLLEARRMLTSAALPVTTVAYEVGYGSPNQFSREYARKFGVPPSTHLAGEGAARDA